VSPDSTGKTAGQWDWYGACDPGGYPAFRDTFARFSVGCFQWIPRSGGTRKGLKKGPVVKRFSGPTHDAQAVYDKAQAWCDEKNREAARG
jgi:hypothetical protein